jgi:cell wall-associated NlpC family hydrolase
MGYLVSDGTEFSCPHCTSPLKLSVSSSPAQGASQNIANTANSSFPPPGGNCLIDNSPCNPSVQVADPGQNVVQVNNQTALGANCKFSCSKGGTLQPSNPGQTTASHGKSNPPTSSEPQISCKDIRGKILAEAKALAKSANVIYYSQDGTCRQGSTPQGKKAIIQYHYYHQKTNLTTKKDGPIVSFDCSGFVSQVFLNIGKPLKNYGASTNYPIVSEIYNLSKFNHNIPLAQAQPGDLIVWIKPNPKSKQSNHVGIYEGNNSFISALRNVLKDGTYITSVRPITVKAFGEPNPQILRFTDCEGS